MSEEIIEDSLANEAKGFQETIGFQETGSFEENIKNAQLLLDKLIDPEITLSQSVSVYKEGIKELEKAQKLLDDAKLEFKELAQD